MLKRMVGNVLFYMFIFCGTRLFNEVYIWAPEEDRDNEDAQVRAVVFGIDSISLVNAYRDALADSHLREDDVDF